MNPVSIQKPDESNKIIPRHVSESDQAGKNGSGYSLRVIFLIFLCFFLVWAGGSWYFTSQINTSSDIWRCPYTHYNYQEIQNGNVVYQHDFCQDSLIIFTVLFPFKIIFAETQAGSLDLKSAFIFGWLSLGLWAVFLLLVGYCFIWKNTVESEYVAADLTDFIVTLFKIGVKSVTAAVLFIIGIIWFEEVLQEALNGFADMNLTSMFAASYSPGSMFAFTVFFFSIPAIICLTIVFFIFRSIQIKTIVL
jgi:hypothetical protein